MDSMKSGKEVWCEWCGEKKPEGEDNIRGYQCGGWNDSLVFEDAKKVDWYHHESGWLSLRFKELRPRGRRRIWKRVDWIWYCGRCIVEAMPTREDVGIIEKLFAGERSVEAGTGIPHIEDLVNIRREEAIRSVEERGDPEWEEKRKEHYKREGRLKKLVRLEENNITYVNTAKNTACRSDRCPVISGASVYRETCQWCGKLHHDLLTPSQACEAALGEEILSRLHSS